MDENEYVTVCAGDVGADGSTGDDSGLATIDDSGLATITTGGIATSGAIVGTGGDALVDNAAGTADDVAGALDVLGIVRGAPVDDGMPMLSVEAYGATVDDAAGASDAILVDDVAPVDDGIMVPLLADDADGAAGIMIPMLVGGADGATVDGRISVDDTNCVSVDKGSVDGADGASVDEGSVDAADGATVDEEISVGGELVVLVPIGGGVVDAVASIVVPVGAGTCLRAPLFTHVVGPR